MSEPVDPMHAADNEQQALGESICASRARAQLGMPHVRVSPFTFLSLSAASDNDMLPPRCNGKDLEISSM